MYKLKSKSNFVYGNWNYENRNFGSTGFIGKNLAFFLTIDHTVVCFTRAQLEGDAAQLAYRLDGLDVIINLVGSGIVDKRWAKTYKKEIVESRVQALSKIKLALALCKGAPPLFISASAVGIYRPGTYNDEVNYTYGNDFLSDVVRNGKRPQWISGSWSLNLLY